MGNFEFQSTRPRGRTRLPGLINRLIKKVSIHASSREDATSRFPLIRARRCFNPRVLAGGRDVLLAITALQRAVSIHASSREDATIHQYLIKSSISFNPRVLAGGRDSGIRKYWGDWAVSIHASSREDATNPPVSRVIAVQFQSTRPRGRTRLYGGYTSDYQSVVSIHASSREDATSSPAFTLVPIVFQSTRPRGRTRPLCHNSRQIEACFNPRVLAGGRDSAKTASEVKYNVSIHASSREDATKTLTSISSKLGFNPRVLAGGRDNKGSIKAKNNSSFNPRVLAGGRDSGILSKKRRIRVSIHASSREDATCNRGTEFRIPRVSIHASSREDATSDAHEQAKLTRFNPRVLAGGRDYSPSSSFYREGGFNPRVLAGGRDPPVAGCLASVAVSIHASSREDATCAGE